MDTVEVLKENVSRVGSEGVFVTNDAYKDFVIGTVSESILESMPEDEINAHTEFDILTAAFQLIFGGRL